MKRKMRKLMLFAIFVATAVCLYCAILADLAFGLKICFGITFVLLYIAMNLVPYFLQRRDGASISLKNYLAAEVLEA